MAGRAATLGRGLLVRALAAAPTCLPRAAARCCPQVGISSVWWEGNPCNMHLNDLAAEVKAGVQEAGEHTGLLGRALLLPPALPWSALRG